MKKIICLIVLSFVFVFPSTIRAGESLDQICNMSSERSQLIGAGGHVIYQSFKTGFDFISAAAVLLKTDGVGEVRLSILSSDGRTVLASGTAKEVQSNKKEYYFKFTPIKVTKGGEYMLIAEPTKIENRGVSWYYVQNENGSCYPDGKIITNTEDSKTDMVFATYGYNESNIPPSPSVTPKPSVQTKETDTEKPKTPDVDVVVEEEHVPVLGQEEAKTEPREKKETENKANKEEKKADSDPLSTPPMPEGVTSSLPSTVKSAKTNKAEKSDSKYAVFGIIGLVVIGLGLMGLKNKTKKTK